MRVHLRTVGAEYTIQNQTDEEVTALKALVKSGKGLYEINGSNLSPVPSPNEIYVNVAAIIGFDVSE